MRNKLFILTSLLAAPALFASVAEWKPFEQKVAEAEAIVHGTVVGSETRRDPTGRWLLTYTTIDVLDSLKGNAGTTITVVTPGGSENGLHQRTIGIPELRPGDEHILFTKHASAGLSVLYQDQGNYEVVRDRGETLVVPASSDLILYDSQSGVVQSAEKARPMSEFVRSVEVASRRGARDPFRADTTPRGDDERSFDIDGSTFILIVLGIGIVLALIPLYRRFR